MLQQQKGNNNMNILLKVYTHLFAHWTLNTSSWKGKGSWQEVVLKPQKSSALIFSKNTNLSTPHLWSGRKTPPAKLYLKRIVHKWKGWSGFQSQPPVVVIMKWLSAQEQFETQRHKARQRQRNKEPCGRCSGRLENRYRCIVTGFQSGNQSVISVD